MWKVRFFLIDRVLGEVIFLGLDYRGFVNDRLWVFECIVERFGELEMVWDWVRLGKVYFYGIED